MKTWFCCLLWMAHFLGAEDLRIFTLLPKTNAMLAVDPALPAHFTAASPSGPLDLKEGVYWGPREVLESYFKDSASLSEPIFRFKLAKGTVQTGGYRFNDDPKTILKTISTLGGKNGQIRHYNWGRYPVMTVQADLPSKTLFLGWIGLSVAEGTTLSFVMLYPESPNGPSETDQQLWNRFLTQTAQLPEPEFYRALGQELEEGQTFFRLGNIEIKITAERRLADQKLQVLLTPLNQETRFLIIDIEEGLMGNRWKKDHPLVKILGTAEDSMQKVETAIAVLIKNVEAFTLTSEQGQELGYFVYEK